MNENGIPSSAPGGVGGRALRRMRQHVGLTQRELARRARVSENTVWELERQPRNGQALERLTVALMTAGYLTGGPLDQHLERRLIELEQRLDQMDRLLFGSFDEEPAA